MHIGQARTVALLHALALGVAIMPAPAHADRHCGPALALYTAARDAAQADGTCEDRRGMALERLAEAAQAAFNCGCVPLRTEIEALSREVEGLTCEGGLDAVLDARPRITRIHDACM
jgi:hypothetical protein